MRLIKILFLAAVFATIFSQEVDAQKTKIGYTNIELVVSLMPETKAMKGQLEVHEQKLAQNIEVKKVYFQGKVEELKAQQGKIKPEEFQAKEKELQKLQEEIQKSIEDAEQNFQKKKEELLGPILDKLQKAIDEIYTTENYEYIFNSNATGTSIIIKGPEQDNITLKILGKLGIEPPKELLDQIKGNKK